MYLNRRRKTVNNTIVLIEYDTNKIKEFLEKFSDIPLNRLTDESLKGLALLITYQKEKNLKIVIEANKELYKLLKIELKPKYEFEKVLIK